MEIFGAEERTEQSVHVATEKAEAYPQQRLAVLSLLLDPIVRAPDWDKLGDGTHRVCAARQQQVAQVLCALPAAVQWFSERRGPARAQLTFGFTRLLVTGRGTARPEPVRTPHC
jgi:hypothetical protein